MKLVEERVVKIPIDEIRALVKKNYGLDLTGIEPYLDEDNLAFCMRLAEETLEVDRGRGPENLRKQPSDSVAESEDGVRTSEVVPQIRVEPSGPGTKRVRRRRRKRNRIRTRGWRVIAKITNSGGLVANVYEPLVKVLENRQIAKSEQRKAVRQLMVQNGNNPSPESVDYFLENTLEYLRQREVRMARVP